MNEFALIDERGRAAGAGLRAAASFRPDPATTPTHAPSRTPRGMVWAAALALVAVIAGVVYLTGRDTPPADEPAPTSLRYVLGDLPDGWSVTSAKDVGVATSERVDADVRYVLYGTSGDPTAPTLLLMWSGDVQPFAVSDFQALGGDYREFNVGAEDAVCGEAPPMRPLICAVPTPAGSGLGTVVVRAGGMTLDELVSILSSLAIDGEPVLPIEALPPGAVLLDRGVGFGSMDVATGDPDRANVASVEYATADREVVFLLTGDGAAQQLAAAATVGAWSRRVVGGVTYFVMDAVDGGNAVVHWSKDGRVFALGAPLSADEIIRLAASVRPATDDEWAAFTPRPGAITGGTITPTVDTEVAAPTSIAVETTVAEAPAYEVEVGMTVEPLAGGRVRLSSTGEGTSTDTFTLRLSETEFAFAAGSFSSAGGLNPNGTLVNPINASPGVWAIIPGGGTLVVRTVDGGQYTAPTSRPVDGVAVDFALVAVTIEVEWAELRDASGIVVERWFPEG